MKRTRNAWMKADDFGRSLPRGIGINLLVPEIAPMEAFCRDVLGARIVYADEDFAAVELLGSVFMLHADHSYLDNPMTGVIDGVELRGARHRDPHLRRRPGRDRSAGARAGHGCSPVRSTSRMALRECHIVGPNGYIFVPSAALPADGIQDRDIIATFPAANRILTICG